ncbi:MAG TPA: helix-turn-helix domain-containing protein [Blastocatellia bacterium]|nr:helix-turn-helix domain-containing protein [Blastocatellia bacterium]
MESLGEYLDRLMRQKNLTPKELARRCKVTDSYIGRVRKGASGNLTVQTMMTLAKGLGVNAHDIFTAASGIPPEEDLPIDPLLLLDHMQKLIHDRNGLDVLRQWLDLSSSERQTLHDFLAYLNDQPDKAKGKPHKK